MERSQRWPRRLLIGGCLLMVLGAADPLEGSVVIVAGTAAASVGAWLGGSRFRTLLLGSTALVWVGVALMFGLSALGGVGGSTGRSVWWAVVVLPYPVGWIGALIAAVRSLRPGGSTVLDQRARL